MKNLTFLREYINIEKIKGLMLDGKGGKDKELTAVLKNSRRISNPLYDAILLHKNKEYKIEIKRQRNTQWFDICKYYNLKAEEKKIVMLFFMTEDSLITRVVAISLDDFLSLMLSLVPMGAHGWKNNIIETAAQLKKECPTIQFKAKANIKNLIKNYPKKFTTVHSTVLETKK